MGIALFTFKIAHECTAFQDWHYSLHFNLPFLKSCEILIIYHKLFIPDTYLYIS